MMPVYGMAEATLAISFTPLMKPSVITAFDASLLDRERIAKRVEPDAPEARILSAVGIALNNVNIRIVDDKELPLENGIAGHIQLKGAGITKGYFRNPAATASAFCGEWLRTGDIGFFYEGLLYISGRHKDIIFKNGRNYFANDLESMACTIDDISYGKVCFGGTTSKETGLDKVIVFVAGIPETKAFEKFMKLRGLLRSNLGITVDEMILIKSMKSPKPQAANCNDIN